MENQLFRKKSLEQISSPEQLNDYLRVTNPAVWLVLTAVILLLVGVIIWSATASIDSIATGTGQVKDGTMQVTFDDPQIMHSINVGMTVKSGDTIAQLSSVGYTEDGKEFWVAPTTLADGSYPVQVIYKSTQVLRLLFN